jgi:glycine C-acetyltransferase
MYGTIGQSLQEELDAIRAAGTFKEERVITSPQDAVISVASGQEVLNFCANNYLGLADDADIIAAAKDALDFYGFGMSSVRFICGTLDLHKKLEATVSRFLQMEDTILYSSCFDANGGLFETILGEQDAVVSDALNHASIIDGIRLCKAMRYPTTTWPISTSSSTRLWLRALAGSWWPRTACSAWTATSPGWTR